MPKDQITQAKMGPIICIDYSNIQAEGDENAADVIDRETSAEQFNEITTKAGDK